MVFSDEGEVKIRYNKVPIVKKLYGEASPFYDVEKFKEKPEGSKAAEQRNPRRQNHTRTWEVQWYTSPV